MSFVSKKTISHTGCVTQLFFLFFVVSESFTLSAMAYDHVAICDPLVYTATVSPQVCLFLFLVVYVMGFPGAMAHIVCMIRMTFCASNLVDHYVCDILPFLMHSCTIHHVNKMVVFVVSIDTGVPTITVFISYALIPSNSLYIHFTEGNFKDFSTYSSHMIAVSLFFGSRTFMYLKPYFSFTCEPEKSILLVLDYCGAHVQLSNL